MILGRVKLMTIISINEAKYLITFLTISDIALFLTSLFLLCSYIPDVALFTLFLLSLMSIFLLCP